MIKYIWFECKNGAVLFLSLHWEGWTLQLWIQASAGGVRVEVGISGSSWHWIAAYKCSSCPDCSRVGWNTPFWREVILQWNSKSSWVSVFQLQSLRPFFSKGDLWFYHPFGKITTADAVYQTEDCPAQSKAWKWNRLKYQWACLFS